MSIAEFHCTLSRTHLWVQVMKFSTRLVRNSVQFRVSYFLLVAETFRSLHSPANSTYHSSGLWALEKNELGSLLDVLYLLQTWCPSPPSDRVINPLKRYRCSWLDFCKIVNTSRYQWLKSNLGNLFKPIATMQYLVNPPSRSLHLLSLKLLFENNWTPKYGFHISILWAIG